MPGAGRHDDDADSGCIQPNRDGGCFAGNGYEGQGQLSGWSHHVRLNRHYDAMADSDSFYEFTAFDETGVVGHLIMRFTDEAKKSLRFGFVIVDSQKRGRGYGREMLKLAIRYGFEILKAEKITLGVFENNKAAYHCYRAAGFQEVSQAEPEIFHILNEDWKCIELEFV